MASEVTPTDAADRVGFGHDRHPFGPGEPLRLGGIELPGAPRLHGHSDGDVVLHAIADAILGAAGLGDLGRLAPSDSRTPRGIASGTLVEIARGRALDAGWRVRRVEVTVTGARPRFGEALDRMRDAIAGLLDLEASAVAVKGSSGNLQGPEGEGRAIAAEALVALAPLVALVPAGRAAGER